MKITKTAQKVAVDILEEFFCTRTMEEVLEAYERLKEKYGLMDDPFTGFPCMPEEWCKSKLEYERQTMDELYGHHDGLE